MIIQLDNPETADFAVTQPVIEERDGGGYDIFGALTTKNPFGVERRLSFSCEVSSGGTAHAIVKGGG